MDIDTNHKSDLSLTIQVVGFNSAVDLPLALSALQTVPKQNARVVYIDNASQDRSVELVQESLPHAHVIRLAKNVGFSQAHNLGIKQCTTPFILILNPDMALDWTGIHHLLSAFTDTSVAAVQGKIFRTPHEDRVLDSAGIVLTLSLNGRERGAYEIDSNQFSVPANLTAVSGACALYRLSALRSVAHSSNEFFDADFFAYKEDVDLGWRLQRAGWQIRYLPVIAGTHGRRVGKRGRWGWELGPRAFMSRLRDPQTRYSFRNWIWMITKNASAVQVFIHSPAIAARLMVFLGLTVVYPPFATAWLQAIRGFPKIINKRTTITKPSLRA